MFLFAGNSYIISELSLFFVINKHNNITFGGVANNLWLFVMFAVSSCVFAATSQPSLKYYFSKKGRIENVSGSACGHSTQDQGCKLDLFR